MRNILVALLMTAMCVAQLPDNPTPQTKEQAAAKTSWRVLPERVKPQHRHWVARHPVPTGSLIGGGAGVLIWLLTRHSCPTMINGYPYTGNQKPCPNPKTYDPGPKK